MYDARVNRLSFIFHNDSANERYVKITIGFRCVFELAKRVMFILFVFSSFSVWLYRLCSLLVDLWDPFTHDALTLSLVFLL